MSERKQFGELTKLFWGRFLENDLISLDGDVRATVVTVLALLATPGVMFPLISLDAYSNLSGAPLCARDWFSMPERLFYLCFSMAVLGIVTVLEWDTLLPDRRDYNVLRPFPVQLRTVFAAKIAALAGFWAVLTLAMNAVSTVMFPLVVVQKGSLGLLAWFVGCHAVAVLAGNAFIFLSILAIQGLLMNLLGWRSFRRVCPYVQLLLIGTMLAMFLASSGMARRIDLSGPAPQGLLFFPPAWFLGLCQNALGWMQPVFRELADRARLSLGITVLAAVAAYGLSYKRHVRKSIEALDSPAAAPGFVARALSGLVNRFALHTAFERAVFHFARQTLFRSRKHRLLLGAFTGAGCAIVFQILAEIVSRGRHDWWWRPNRILLLVPLVLSSFVLWGMRYVFTIPAELRANWIFQVSGRSDARHYAAGTRKAMLLLGVAPLFGLLLPVHGAIWGWTNAVVHVLFGCTLAVLLADILLVGFNKAPFMCSYCAGKASIQHCWPLYASGLLLYLGSLMVLVRVLTSLELWILESPLRILWVFAAASAVEAGISLYRRRALEEGIEIAFDERPEPVVTVLDLEG